MISRCYNVNIPNYSDYGGRGITVCARWLESYENFLLDVGRSPYTDYTIDRIDVNGNYEPENVRWASRAEQNRNRRDTKIVEYNGISMCLAQWAVRVGINYHTLHARLRHGWSFDRAINDPIEVHKKDKLK